VGGGDLAPRLQQRAQRLLQALALAGRAVLGALGRGRDAVVVRVVVQIPDGAQGKGLERRLEVFVVLALDLHQAVAPLQYDLVIGQ
jgi:hypothetical protein